MEILNFTQEYCDQYKFVARQFQSFIGEDKGFADITKEVLLQYVKYLRNKYPTNTVTTKMSQLKAILNKATGMYDIPYKEYSTVLKGKRQENTAIYLRPTELNKIQRTKVISDTERYAKALFLIQAWTGARYSDAKDFDSQNIQGEQLDYVTQKTGTRVSVPLKPIVREMIKEKETLDPISITSYEGIIKAIAYKARLRDQVKVFKKGKYLKGYKYEFVTGHTARRSFATNLMMSGVDVFTISKLMGHSSPIMTQKYICEVMDNDKLKKILS